MKIPIISHCTKAGLRWIPALCFALLIFCFSATTGDEIGQSYDMLTRALEPTPAIPASQTRESTSPLFSNLDWLKVGHGIGYFCLGIAVLYALPLGSRWTPSIALIICTVYGFSDELHQLFVPGRSASARDILIDTLAALGGVSVLLMAKTIFRFNHKQAW
jgi:VanZ family protein